MKRLGLKIIGALAISVFFLSCGGSKKIDTETLHSELDSINKVNDAPDVNTEAVKEILQSIPSPIEISFLIKETGSNYNQVYLNDPDNKDSYTNSYKKALNLGVYGADLAYTNIYNKSQDGIYYLDAVTDMANGLDIGQFFDYSTLKELIKHNDNLDSLLLITTSNFEKINNYLQEKNRAQISVMLLYGGWVEGLHLLNKVNKATPNEEIKERIGEQKVMIEQLSKLLGYYEFDPNVKELLSELSKLKKVYDEEVKIETVEGETTFEIIDGAMTPVSNSYTEVIISDETVTTIDKKVTELRSQIINK